MESLYLLILVFIIIIFIFPFKINLKICYDFKKNYGALSIGRFFVAKIKRKGREIILITKNRKNNVDVDFEFGEKQLRFIKYFKDEIKNKIKIKTFNVYSKIGTTDAFSTAIISSSFSVFIGILLSRFKMKQPTASFVHRPVTIFNQSHLIFATTTKIYVSIFDLLYSFLMAISKSRSDKKQEETLKNI